MLSRQIFHNRHFSVYLLMGITAVFVLFSSSLQGTAVIAAPETDVCGPIASNTTWTPAGSPYIITCTVQVTNGVTLTIQPGTLVKFNLDTSLSVDGELIAQQVTFTTNDPTPADGDWDHILFNPTSVDAAFDAQGNYVSGSIIQDSLLEYGGGGSASGVLEINLASPFIHQNTIRNISTNKDGINATGRSPGQLIRISYNYIGPDSFSGDGLTITNGQAMSNTISSVNGTGIVATNSTLMGNNIVGNNRGISAVGSTITDNTVNGNSFGGGIEATGSTITANTISGNAGRGIDTDGNSVVTGNTVTNNSQGGIYASGGMISHNTIIGNSTTSSGGGIYANNATVINNAVSSNTAADGGGIYGDDSNLTSNTVTNNNASDNGGGIYIRDNSIVVNNTVELNTADVGGGIFAYGTNGALELTSNMITQNNANTGGGIYADGNYPSTYYVRLTGNTILTNTAQLAGGGLYVERSIAESNMVAHNTVPTFGRGSGVYLEGEVEFLYNDVLTNTASGGTVGGVTIEGQPVQFQYNNIFSNAPYDAETISADDVDGSMNYWGQSDCLAIVEQIYDGDDMPGRGELTYAPSLYEPAAMTQFTTPENLKVVVNSDGSVTLGWDAVPALPEVGCRPTDGILELGYRLYYDTEDNCTFDGTSLTQGSSPIDAGDNIEITLTDLSQQNDYYFAVVAYDYLGRESPYSNLVTILHGINKIFLPLVQRGDL